MFGEVLVRVLSWPMFDIAAKLIHIDRIDIFQRVRVTSGTPLMHVRACKTGNKRPLGRRGVALPPTGGATIKVSRTRIVRVNPSRLHQRGHVRERRAACHARTHAHSRNSREVNSSAIVRRHLRFN